QYGWLVGADRSGVAQAAAGLGMFGSEASPLADSRARQVGWAMTPYRTNGKLTGFLVAWVVAP
ncbi:MAG: hypothetical protein FWD74_00160, partial [Actinomycetia bacterium]|nr:hypothetical protein [Actinomycetes bacterium]